MCVPYVWQDSDDIDHMHDVTGGCVTRQVCFAWNAAGNSHANQTLTLMQTIPSFHHTPLPLVMGSLAHTPLPLHMPSFAHAHSPVFNLSWAN
eukprot:657792-Amorphochlora_amoeboformis.AAC.1